MLVLSIEINSFSNNFINKYFIFWTPSISLLILSSISKFKD